MNTSNFDPRLAILNPWTLSRSGILPAREHIWFPESLLKRHIPLWGYQAMISIQSHTLATDWRRPSFQDISWPLLCSFLLLEGQGKGSLLPSSPEGPLGWASKEPTQTPSSPFRCLHPWGHWETARSCPFWVAFVSFALGPLEPQTSPPRSYPFGKLPARPENGLWR